MRVGRFSLVAEVATGSLGARWIGFIAEGSERGRLITARRIRTVADFGAASLLERAATVAKEVRHAKVAAVLDVVRTSSEIVIISESIDGEALSTLLGLAALESSSIPTGVAVAIARDLLDAEMAVRDVWLAQVAAPDDPLRRTVHGGLQPDCVLAATFGEALLTEFGVVGAATSLPRFARLASALPYRAPEQLDPRARIDERADVFTVGVMLWEMLTGQPLFGPPDRLRRPTATGSVHELERQLREKALPSLDTVTRPSGPIEPEVAILVARALQRDPADRYSSLAELREAIDELPARMVADAEEVAATVDRFARGRIAARRAAFEDAVGGRVMGSAPPSSSNLGDLAPSSRSIAVIVPGAEWRGGALPDLAGFGLHELPTRSDNASPATVRGQQLPGPHPRTPGDAASPAADALARSVGTREPSGIASTPPRSPVTAGASAAGPAPSAEFDDDIELCEVPPSTSTAPGGDSTAATAAAPDVAPAPVVALPFEAPALVVDSPTTPPEIEPHAAPRRPGRWVRAAIVLAMLTASGLGTAALLLHDGRAIRTGPTVTVEPTPPTPSPGKGLPGTSATGISLEPAAAGGEAGATPTSPSSSAAASASAESPETPTPPGFPGTGWRPRPKATAEDPRPDNDDGRAYRPSGI